MTSQSVWDIRRRRIAAAVLAGLIAVDPIALNFASANEFPGRDLAIARAAFRDADSGQWRAAENLAARATDRLVYRLIRWIDLQRPNAGHSFQEIADFMAANPDWPHQSLLRLRAEEVMDGVPAPVLADWFATHDPVSPLAKFRFAAILLARGHGEQARSLVHDAWVNGDLSEADEALIRSRFGPLIAPSDEAARLDQVLWRGHYDQAQRLLTRVTAERRILAEARIKLGQSASGAPAALARVPASLRDDPGLTFDRLRWYRRRGDDQAAATLLEHAPAGLVRPEMWWPERQAVARDLLAAGQAQRAYRLVSDNGLADGAMRADAEFTAGWIALRALNSPERALGHFAQVYDSAKLPISLARGAYWAGRAAEASGRFPEAITWYEKAAPLTTTFYGQLAAAMPGIASPPRPTTTEPRPTPAESAQFERKEAVRAVRLLALADAYDYVRPFFNQLSEQARSVADHALVADLAESIGRPDLGVLAAKRASYAGVMLLRAGYPIVGLPRNAGAEQALLLAITRQESAFDLHAVSPTGARGLMQLEPATARITARSLSVPFSLKRLTRDGAYNIGLGQAYVDDLIAEFNGSYLLAIAAYNAGPARVREWIGEFGDPRSPRVDPIDWVESIPFGETRNYVQRVLENLQVYRLRFGDRSLAFSLDADLRR